MRTWLTLLGIIILFVGAVISAIGIPAPLPPELIRIDVTTQEILNPVSEVFSQLNSVTLIGFGVLVIGAIIAVVGVLSSRTRKKRD